MAKNVDDQLHAATVHTTMSTVLAERLQNSFVSSPKSVSAMDINWNATENPYLY